MPTLYLMIGLPGSGKTTLAKRIEQEQGALRLSPDEWMLALAFDGYDEKARVAVETLQWSVAERALALGLNVVVDFGLWSKQEREQCRARAAQLGARSELCFLDVPPAELRERLLRRNAALPPGAFRVDPADIEQWWQSFEPPSPEELRPRGYARLQDGSSE